MQLKCLNTYSCLALLLKSSIKEAFAYILLGAEENERKVM